MINVVLRTAGKRDPISLEGAKDPGERRQPRSPKSPDAEAAFSTQPRPSKVAPSTSGRVVVMRPVFPLRIPPKNSCLGII